MFKKYVISPFVTEFVICYYRIVLAAPEGGLLETSGEIKGIFFFVVVVVAGSKKASMEGERKRESG